MKSKTDNTECIREVRAKDLKSKKIKNRQRHFYSARKAQPEAKVETTQVVSETYACTDKQTLEVLIQNRTAYCRPIQVSTRGVGLIVVSSLMTAAKLSDPYDFPLLSMYRVMLAFTEEKLALIYATKVMGLAYVPVYSLKPNADRVAVLSAVTAFPKFATAYIEGLGTFTHEGIDFVPVLPINRCKKGILCPDPGKIILSNLREMLLSMKNPEMVLQCREEFILRNPIPGAMYNNKYLVENGNDIMPLNYNNEHLRHDIQLCNEFFEKYRKNQSRNNWIGRGPSVKSPEGTPGVAVIQQRLMQIPYNCTVTQLCDDGVAFRILDGAEMFSPIPLQTIEWLHGAACLYREPPQDLQTYPYNPYWDGCEKGSNPYSITAHPANIIKVLFDMKVEPYETD